MCALDLQNVLFTALADTYRLMELHCLAATLSSLPALASLTLHLSSGEFDAHMLTDEVALALAYGTPQLKHLEWVVESITKKLLPSPPAAVVAAALSDNGVAALLSMESLEVMILHAPVVLQQAVSRWRGTLGTWVLHELG